MQYFKTDWSLPPIVQAAPRAVSYRRTVRYGYARLGRPTPGQAAPAPVLIALPRVQAVVDAMIESWTINLQAA
jgi:hypothetical protein